MMVRTEGMMYVVVVGVGVVVVVVVETSWLA